MCNVTFIYINYTFMYMYVYMLPWFKYKVNKMYYSNN